MSGGDERWRNEMPSIWVTVASVSGAKVGGWLAGQIASLSPSVLAPI